jgi:DNA-directed RNA polymerase specialized sigma24 family protein
MTWGRVAWIKEFDGDCTDHIRIVVSDPERRDRAWKALLERIGPWIEHWAQSSVVLRRCGLTSEDESRSVMVNALVRLKANDFENLRRFVASLGGAAAVSDANEASEELAIDGFSRIAAIGRELTAPPTSPAVDDTTGTPLRGWLITTTRYAVKDHVKRRFGWTTTARVELVIDPPAGTSARATISDALSGTVGVSRSTWSADGRDLTIEFHAGAIRAAALVEVVARSGHHVEQVARPTKRDLTTNADRLGPDHDEGERPPMTDYLTMAKLLEEVTTFMTTFPEPMRRAVMMWLEDTSFEDIAAILELAPGAREPVDQARALVRAGQARLREQFRGRWQPFVAAPVAR